MSQSLRTEAFGLASKHWKMAECSLSTAKTRALCFLASCMTTSPAMTRISLEATAMSLPARTAARAGFNPSVPTMAMRTTSAPGSVASSIRPSAPLVVRTWAGAFADSSAFKLPSRIDMSRGSNCRAWATRASTFFPAAKPINRM